MSEEGGDKQFEASQRRLDEARKKGDLVRSADLTTAAAYGGLALFGLTGGAASLMALGQVGQVLLDQPDQLAKIWFDAASAPLGGMLWATVKPTLPFFLAPAAAALLCITAQRAWVIAPEKIRPKLSNLSPMKGFHNKFGMNGLFEFGKSSIKMMVILIILSLFLMSRAERIMATMYLEAGQGASVMVGLMLEFLVLTLAVTGSFAGADYLWQWWQFQQRNRMTRQEMVDEHKDQEGDPHTKGQRRQRAVDIATNQMLADVPKAAVVIVNPTHYAVALKWDRGSRKAPVCVAKGVDEIAARIREKAALAGVPIHSDPPTARALHATVDIGREIQPDHYKAVAAAIRFAETMRKKAKRRR